MKTFSFISLLGFLLLLFSCSDKVSNRFTITLKGNTKQKMKVVLYPKKAYLREDNNTYKASDYSTKYYKIRNNISEIVYDSLPLFETSDAAIKPNDIVLKVFDSIKIEFPDSKIPSINFSPGKASNYAVNMFTTDTFWICTKNVDYENTMFSEHKIEISSYLFLLDSTRIQNK